MPQAKPKYSPWALSDFQNNTIASIRARVQSNPDLIKPTATRLAKEYSEQALRRRCYQETKAILEFNKRNAAPKQRKQADTPVPPDQLNYPEWYNAARDRAWYMPNWYVIQQQYNDSGKFIISIPKNRGWVGRKCKSVNLTETKNFSNTERFCVAWNDAFMRRGQIISAAYLMNLPQAERIEVSGMIVLLVWLCVDPDADQIEQISDFQKLPYTPDADGLTLTGWNHEDRFCLRMVTLQQHPRECLDLANAALDVIAPTIDPPATKAKPDTEPAEHTDDQQLPDGPHKPRLLVWNGTRHELARLPWRLLNFMWHRDRVHEDRVMPAVWPDPYAVTNANLRTLVSRLNTILLRIHDSPFMLRTEEGFVIKVKRRVTR